MENTVFKILKLSHEYGQETPIDWTMGGRNTTHKHTNRVLFQDVDLDHVALCDTQEVETVQIAVGPQGKAQQLHT
jgi:hypothetical protein